MKPLLLCKRFPTGSVAVLVRTDVYRSRDGDRTEYTAIDVWTTRDFSVNEPRRLTAKTLENAKLQVLQFPDTQGPIFVCDTEGREVPWQIPPGSWLALPATGDRSPFWGDRVAVWMPKLP